MSYLENQIRETIGGSGGGVAIVLVGHPLDTIKVRMQTMKVIQGQAPPYKSTLDCALKMMSREGPWSLYKGVTAPLLGVTPMYSLCFFGYGIGKSIFTTEDNFKNLDLLPIALAGATSGLFTTPILAPLERVKCILQTQTANLKPGEKPRFKGVPDLGMHLWKTGGLESINRGFSATMLRDCVASMAYFAGYEWFKSTLQVNDQTSWGQRTWRTLVAGGMAGVLNWLPAIPIDTLKSRLQTAPDGKYPNGIRSVFMEIYRAEGMNTFATLYRGFGPVMIRAFPANAACFLGYETTKQILEMFWARKQLE
mmetsp:Transcript_3777/g.4188  ORF Transcript_3777/g.4188 Transcript_3777/m.4188 type:complete len:309 (+) Transcript_3777:47-973(+)